MSSEFDGVGPVFFRLVLFSALWVSACSSVREDGECGQVLPEPLRLVAHAAIALDPNESTDGLPVLVPLSRDFQAENTLTWLGHSSFLMRIGGKTMLLDPVLVDHLRAPYLPTGHRMVPQVPVLDRLDGLDIILISHGHNDHTNRATLEELRARFPAARAIAPASVEPLLRDIGFGSVTGLNHHEETQAGAIRFISVPVHHALRGTSRKMKIQPPG
jgi:glyoxylase-like metal-dependent hydrolase (beta-lactamase superfamily II)